MSNWVRMGAISEIIPYGKINKKCEIKCFIFVHGFVFHFANFMHVLQNHTFYISNVFSRVEAPFSRRLYPDY